MIHRIEVLVVLGDLKAYFILCLLFNLPVHTSCQILSFYTLSPAALPALGRFIPFCPHHWPPSALGAHLCGAWPVAGRLMWTFLEQRVLLTRATRPLWALTPHCLPSHSFHLGQVFFFSPPHCGTGRKLERQHVVLCSLLGCAAGGRLPMVHQSSHSLFFFSPPPSLSLTSPREGTPVWSH